MIQEESRRQRQEEEEYKGNADIEDIEVNMRSGRGNRDGRDGGRKE